jgi:dUTP pyrophosphatase
MIFVFCKLIQETAEMTTSINFKKLHPNAIIPTKGSKYAAGYDISSIESIVIKPGSRALVKTGLSFEFYGISSVYLRVAPRSGLAYKYGIDVGAGVIDEDFRGEIGVILFNFGSDDFVINVGDRIAQLIIEEIRNVPVREVTELAESDRGSGGFGSTGVAPSL